MSALFSVAGKVALVTGGTSGIGHMIAKTLVANGVKTYITGRSTKICSSCAKELSQHGECIPLTADLSTNVGADTLTAQLAARESHLHILVNNAGAMHDAPLDQFSEEGWDQVMDLNLKSVFFLSQKLLPLLRKGSQNADHTSIINIGSVGGLRIGPKENYSYQASKAGLHHLTASMGRKLGSDNITVNAIAPGLFPSKLSPIPDEQLPAVLTHVPRGRMGTADDIGGAVIYLASPAGSFVTGVVIPVAGGMML